MAEIWLTTQHVWNPINNGINYLSTGAGFQPSTVVPSWSWLSSSALICEICCSKAWKIIGHRTKLMQNSRQLRASFARSFSCCSFVCSFSVAFSTETSCWHSCHHETSCQKKAQKHRHLWNNHYKIYKMAENKSYMGNWSGNNPTYRVL